MRHQLTDHPLRSLALLLALAFAFFLLSASGQPGAGWEQGPRWLGDTAWFAFLATDLVFLLVAALGITRFVRSRGMS
jgi:hypothetical protein